jgi:hypothetical protein
MANVNVTSDTWTEISITSGTVQNISATADIELSAEQTDNSGVVLKPSELYQWDNETIYARAVTEDTGALRVVNFKRAAGGGGGSYTLPAATASKLGGVKIGSNVSIDESGVISVAAPYSLPKAAANTLGGIKVGSGLSISDGVLSVTGGGSGDPVGRVVFDVVLRDGYIKANGATVSDASTSIPNLLAFVQDNPSLLAEDSAAYAENVGLYLYDSGTDELTLPNYTGRVMQGGANVESIEAGLPNIKGEIKMHYGNLNSASATGAIYTETPDHRPFAGTQDSSSNMCNDMFKFDASKSNAIYSDSVSTVQSPAINMIPQI